MDFFLVDKAKVYNPETGKEFATDIRMVYNGTSCGLNDVLWASWFGLPSMDAMTRTVEAQTWAADNDYGDMFMNYWLDNNLRQYCGIDITKLYPEEVKASGHPALWETWTRPAMGLKPSPYQAYQGAMIAKHLTPGAPEDDTPFAWKSVEMNLPGDKDYRPGRPWVSKR